jgi:hypothetical protein
LTFAQPSKADPGIIATDVNCSLRLFEIALPSTRAIPDRDVFYALIPFTPFTEPRRI